jgi:hypothetical protein
VSSLLCCFWAFYSGIRRRASDLFVGGKLPPLPWARLRGSRTRRKLAPATVGAPVHMNDQLVTGLQVTVRDGTVLTFRRFALALREPTSAIRS